MIISGAEVDEQILDSIIKELKIKHRCHTVMLYGSRARGQRSHAHKGFRMKIVTVT